MLLDRYDLGVAVDTDAGLVVPVVRGCDRLSVAEIDAEIRRLADGARAGSLQPDELRDSTFTVTSAGKLGGLFVTPLINHPEVAILGLHRIGPRPVVRDGEIVVREMGNVSVTFDHRVVDGARAGAFCVDVIGRLETASPYTDRPRWVTGTRSESPSASASRPGSPSPACSRVSGSASPTTLLGAVVVGHRRGPARQRLDSAPAGGVVGAVIGSVSAAAIVRGAGRRGATRRRHGVPSRRCRDRRRPARADPRRRLPRGGRASRPRGAARAPGPEKYAGLRSLAK